MNLKTIALLVVALSASCLAHAGTLHVPLQAGQDLVVDVPEGWSGQVQPQGADRLPSISVSAAAPMSLRLLIAPQAAGRDGKPPTSAQLRALVHAAADAERARLVEADFPLQELGMAGKAGYYFSATDRAPATDGYLHVSRGALGVGALTVQFAILVNGEPADGTAQALEIVRSLRLAKAGSAR